MMTGVRRGRIGGGGRVEEEERRRRGDESDREGQKGKGKANSYTRNRIPHDSPVTSFDSIKLHETTHPIDTALVYEPVTAYRGMSIEFFDY